VIFGWRAAVHQGRIANSAAKRVELQATIDSCIRQKREWEASKSMYQMSAESAENPSTVANMPFTAINRLDSEIAEAKKQLDELPK
jgi:hypothetical protein